MNGDLETVNVKMNGDLSVMGDMELTGEIAIEHTQGDSMESARLNYTGVTDSISRVADRFYVWGGEGKVGETHKIEMGYTDEFTSHGGTGNRQVPEAQSMKFLVNDYSSANETDMELVKVLELRGDGKSVFSSDLEVNGELTYKSQTLDERFIPRVSGDVPRCNLTFGFFGVMDEREAISDEIKMMSHGSVLPNDYDITPQLGGHPEPIEQPFSLYDVLPEPLESVDTVSLHGVLVPFLRLDDT